VIRHTLYGVRPQFGPHVPLLRHALRLILAKRLFSAYWLLTAGYIVTGKLALLLAVPPGYASPIFPPAGIAIAAMLITGWATLPWTFLGSFLLNVSTASPVGRESTMSWLAAAAVIASASALQAAIGGVVLRRAVGYPAPLDNGRDLWRFLSLSPICCLTSATLSLGGLLNPPPLPADRWHDTRRAHRAGNLSRTVGKILQPNSAAFAG